MLDIKIISDIKKLSGLLKKLSLVSDSNFVLFPSEDSTYEMPGDKYFEIIQRVFSNPSPIKVILN